MHSQIFSKILKKPSGKEKAHKHKQISPVTARAGGGSPDRAGRGVSRPVARGQKFMCCARNPRNINVFVRVPGREESGSRPGGSVTGVTEKLFICQMFMCLFRPLQTVLEQKVGVESWPPIMCLLPNAIGISSYQGRKRNPTQPKFCGPDIFGWGGGLPREGVGAKKFGMSFETHGSQTFWRDIPGFWWDIPGVPKKFEKKKFVFNARPLP